MYKDVVNREKIMSKISEFYETAIEATDFYYPYIKNTKSYASINWIYGMFLCQYAKDFKRAARYLEDAIEICRRLHIKDKIYYSAIHNLTQVYIEIFKSKKDENYLKAVRPLYSEVMKNAVKASATGFKIGLYKKMADPYMNKRTLAK